MKIKVITYLFILCNLIFFISSCDEADTDIADITEETQGGPVNSQVVIWKSEMLPPEAMISMKCTANKSIGESRYLIYSYAVYGGGVGIAIMQTNDPLRPVEIGYLGSCEDGEEYNGVTGLCLREDLIFVATYKYLWIIDISDIRNPLEIGRKSSLAANNIALSGDYAYIIPTNTLDRLIAVDITVPLNPEISNSLELPCSISKMVISESILYAFSSSGLVLIDITSPGVPEQAGFLANPSSEITGTISPGGYIPPNFIDMAVSDRFIYIVSGVYKLFIADISIPSSPVLVSSLDTIDQGTVIVIDEKMAYILTSNGPITFTQGISHEIGLFSIADDLRLRKLDGIKLDPLPSPEAGQTGLQFSGMIKIDEALYLGGETSPTIEIIKF